MESTKIQFVQPPCGKRSNCVFYSAISYVGKDNQQTTLSPGKFFFFQISEHEPICIGELRLLWYDERHDNNMTCSRLYFLPEATPDGRQPRHGQDELLCLRGKVVMKLEDLVQCIPAKVEWDRGSPTLCDANYVEEKDRQREELLQQNNVLADGHQFMQDRATPIDRVPHLGFRQLDLFTFFTLVHKMGGYEAVTEKRLWKNIYDEMGGHPSNTSAATCTRRHYEKLLLSFDRVVRGEPDRKACVWKPRSMNENPNTSRSPSVCSRASDEASPAQQQQASKNKVDVKGEVEDDTFEDEGELQIDLKENIDQKAFDKKPSELFGTTNDSQDKKNNSSTDKDRDKEFERQWNEIRRKNAWAKEQDKQAPRPTKTGKTAISPIQNNSAIPSYLSQLQAAAVAAAAAAATTNGRNGASAASNSMDSFIANAHRSLVTSMGPKYVSPSGMPFINTCPYRHLESPMKGTPYEWNGKKPKASTEKPPPAHAKPTVTSLRHFSDEERTMSWKKLFGEIEHAVRATTQSRQFENQHHGPPATLPPVPAPPPPKRRRRVNNKQAASRSAAATSNNSAASKQVTPTTSSAAAAAAAAAAASMHLPPTDQLWMQMLQNMNPSLSGLGGTAQQPPLFNPGTSSLPPHLLLAMHQQLLAQQQLQLLHGQAGMMMMPPGYLPPQLPQTSTITTTAAPNNSSLSTDAASQFPRFSFPHSPLPPT